MTPDVLDIHYSKSKTIVGASVGVAAAGIGYWPDAVGQPQDLPALGPGQSGGAVIDLQLALDAIGYRIEGTGAYDAQTEAVVTAFQRHWRQARVDGIADGETQAIAAAIACSAALTSP